MVRVFAFENDHNSDPDDFNSQRYMKNRSRKPSAIFWHSWRQKLPREPRAHELGRKLERKVCQSVGKLVSIVVSEVPVEVPMVNRMYFRYLAQKA
jgi:hypothetical protein